MIDRSESILKLRPCVLLFASLEHPWGSGGREREENSSSYGEVNAFCVAEARSKMVVVEYTGLHKCFVPGAPFRTKDTLTCLTAAGQSRRERKSCRHQQYLKSTDLLAVRCRMEERCDTVSQLLSSKFDPSPRDSRPNNNYSWNGLEYMPSSIASMIKYDVLMVAVIIWKQRSSRILTPSLHGGDRPHSGHFTKRTGNLDLGNLRSCPEYRGRSAYHACVYLGFSHQRTVVCAKRIVLPCVAAVVGSCVLLRTPYFAILFDDRTYENLRNFYISPNQALGYILN